MSIPGNAQRAATITADKLLGHMAAGFRAEIEMRVEAARGLFPRDLAERVGHCFDENHAVLLGMTRTAGEA